MSAAAARKLLLIDANVLIDYVRSDTSVLAVACRHLGPVHVLGTVLDEVDGLDAAACERLGLQVVEPELAQLQAAAAARGALSLQDHLCLLVARSQGWVCVTNDRALRKACDVDGIAVLWGLEVMVELVGMGHLSAAAAIAVANRIHQENPFHITEKLVRRFADRVRRIEA